MEQSQSSSTISPKNTNKPKKHFGSERYAPKFKAKVLKFIFEESDDFGWPTECQSSSSNSNNTNNEVTQKEKCKKQTITAAAAKFNVHPRTIADWIENTKRQSNLKEMMNGSTTTRQEILNTENKSQTLSPKKKISSNNHLTKNDPIADQISTILKDVRTNESEPLNKHLSSDTIKDKVRQQLHAVIIQAQTTSTSSAPSITPWYKIWWNRFMENYHNANLPSSQTESNKSAETPSSSTNKIQKRLSYPASFKEEIRQYAEIIGQRTASRIFCISQKRVFEWVTEAKGQPNSSSRRRTAVLNSRRKNLSKLRKTLPVYKEPLNAFQTHLCKPPIKEIDRKVEDELREWMQGELPRKVTSTEVRDKAVQVYRKHGRLNIECSYGWYRRFKARIEKISSESPHVPKKLHAEEDSTILTWLLQVYDDNQLISYKDLQAYAQNALKYLKPDFKASAGWALRFLKRNHLILNYEGIYKGQFSPPLEAQINDFNIQVKSLLPHYEKNHIGCMDEIPLSFSSPINKLKTDEFEQDQATYKTSMLKKLSIKNCDATVILALLANGTLLPPLVIVKGQELKTDEEIYITPEKAIVYYNSTTEPSLNCLEKWVDLVWREFVPNPSLLIIDSYEGHKQLHKKFEDRNIKCLLIPSGCSLKMQPLNITTKITFLKNVEKFWLEYLQPSNDIEESLGRLKLPTTNDIVEWVQKAHELTQVTQLQQATDPFGEIFT